MVGLRLWPDTRFVLSHLPAETDSPTIRRRGLARVAMSQMFAAAARKDWAAVRAHWWEVCARMPSWLRNRGVWAIGVRALVRRGVKSGPVHGEAEA